MSNAWKVVIAVVITAVIVGGGGYYYLNNKATKEKEDLQAQIEDLNQQIGDLTTSDDETTAENVDTPTVANTTSNSEEASSGSCASSSMYTYEKLKNGYIADPITGYANAKLVNGVYTKGTKTITLVENFIACDTSGNNDASIILKYNDGGTGYIYYVETLAPFRDTYAATAWAQLGDRVIMQSLSMVSDVVTAKYLSQGPNDSAASPTQSTSSVYKVPTSGTALIKQ